MSQVLALLSLPLRTAFYLTGNDLSCKEIFWKRPDGLGKWMKKTKFTG
jgi:hypothetical protein